MEKMSSEILTGATQLKKDATNINRYYYLRTYGPAIGIIIFIILIIILRYYLF
jgi:hypothetical protein